MAECGHVDQILVTTTDATGCEVCLRTGGRWVNLRLCLYCGHVGCCDSSPGKHATQHYREQGHPVVQLGIQGGEERWCYADSVFVPIT